MLKLLTAVTVAMILRALMAKLSDLITPPVYCLKTG